MGRGRAKAKQTKVARTLKYQDIGTDLTKLADELHHSDPARSRVVEEPDDESRYSQWSDFEPGERDSA